MVKTSLLGAACEKNVNKCSEEETLSYLDWFFYKNIATIESIEKYGWKYIEKPKKMAIMLLY